MHRRSVLVLIDKSDECKICSTKMRVVVCRPVHSKVTRLSLGRRLEEARIVSRASA